MELIRSTYIHAAWKILTRLWGFGSLGVCPQESRYFHSLNTFILLRSFHSRVLTFSQSPTAFLLRRLQPSKHTTCPVPLWSQCCYSWSTPVLNCPSCRCPRLPDKPARVLSEHPNDVVLRHQNCLKQTKHFNKTRFAKSTCR